MQNDEQNNKRIGTKKRGRTKVWSEIYDSDAFCLLLGSLGWRPLRQSFNANGCKTEKAQKNESRNKKTCATLKHHQGLA
jgi:hypothetical protein